MAEETRKCAYDDLKPLFTLIHLYGVNWKFEKGPGCFKLLSRVFWSIFYACSTIFCVGGFFSELKHNRGLNSERITSQINILIVLLGVNAISFVVCLTQRQHSETLVRFFKQSDYYFREEGASVGRWRKAVRIASTYLYAIFPVYFLTAFIVTADLSHNGGATVESVLGHPVELTWFIVRAAMVTLFILAFVFFLAPSFLICSLAYYVGATCHDSLTQLKRCRSTMKKARMSGRVLRKYARLNEMVAAADGLGAITMYVIKMATVTVFLQTALNMINLLSASWMEANQMTTYAMVTLYLGFGSTFLAIYCCFIRLTHSANKQVAHLSKSLAEVWRADDPALYADSRLYLLKMRVDQLIALTHLMIDRPAFTLLGEPVDGQYLFILCADIVDSANSAFSRLNNSYY